MFFGIHTVDVGSTACVVAGEDRLELDNALVVTGLDTTEESSVEVGGIGRVTVAAGLDTGVDTLLWCKSVRTMFQFTVRNHKTFSDLQWRCSARDPCRYWEGDRKC
jgi:hypothetical protein